MGNHAITPTLQDIFGELPEASNNFAWWSGIRFSHAANANYNALEKAILAGHSIHTLYNLLCGLPANDRNDSPSFQVRRSFNLIFINASLTQQLIDGFFQDWSDYPEELCGEIFPFIPDAWSLGMAKRGLSLMRDAGGRLRAIEDIEKIVKSKDQAAVFFLSAICNDDLQAIDHLQQSTLLRSYYTERDCRDAVDGILRYEGSEDDEKSHFYENYRPFPTVAARYHHRRPMRDYWTLINVAIADESMEQMHRAFDPDLSRRLGSDAFLEIAKEKLTGDKLLIAQAFLVKHIQAGADCKRACLALLHGRIEAMDFMDEPLLLDEVIDEAMSKERKYALFPLFMLLFPIEEVAAHPRGRECLVVLHSITRDPSYLPLIDDLQYQATAFAADLGL